ncbi:P-loopcontaining nucleoside triphosphate hydrolase protein [Moniliophthora roreri MCA 2997]|uniref:P-loopcontaining nucleoside triphosphate hydrolase protein n=1 Tax=Moniliophthora roreri (strain MCA 2997) TaxID=1381753 RepID=V2XC43_MONRO|nr:P-loopcontaining nucleoside triphosphate hydrolase protein [Moniliophthora roreri MCA 2997]
MANTTGVDACLDGGLDWYSTALEETPCRTYERLRRICNPNYNVPFMTIPAPGDSCDDDLGDCCCNSISFSLSMLCLTCQKGLGTNQNIKGINAFPGSYAKYLTHGPGLCGTQVNKTLPDVVQTAVCRQGIKLYDAFYNRVFWDDGSWFFEWTSNFLSQQQSAFGEQAYDAACSPPSSASLSASVFSVPSSTDTVSIPLSASTEPQTTSIVGQSDGSRLSVGAIAGIAVGAGIVGIVAAGAVFFLACRNRRFKRHSGSRWQMSQPLPGATLLGASPTSQPRDSIAVPSSSDAATVNSSDGGSDSRLQRYGTISMPPAYDR